MKKFFSILFLSLFLTGLIVACGSQSATTPVAESPSQPTAELLIATEIPATAAPTEAAAASATESPVKTAAPILFEARIKLFTYQPSEIEIPAGTTVVWLNEDDIQHSVTSGTSDKPTNQFDTDFFVKDETAAVTFDEPGRYIFFCKRHNHMRGVVMVMEG